MHVVEKYFLLQHVTNILIPEDAAFIEVTLEDNIPVVYAIIDPHSKPLLRRFTKLRSGKFFCKNSKMYLGTVIYPVHPVVAEHIFLDRLRGSEGSDQGSER